MDQTNSSEVNMMTPYLHFSGGDHLYFRSWHPSSPGAIAGASIAIVILAILERLLHATRRVIDARWKGALALNATLPTRERQDGAQVEVIGLAKVPYNTQGSRTLPPIVLSCDVARGALYALQASLVYALMLAVMTFQTAYIISIVVGLGLGEALFGRLAFAQL